MIKSTFIQGLINRSHFEASFREVGQGGEGAHPLRRAGSHGEGANFSTYFPLANTTADGTAHCQKCSVFSFGHQNQEYA